MRATAGGPRACRCPTIAAGQRFGGVAPECESSSARRPSACSTRCPGRALRMACSQRCGARSSAGRPDSTASYPHMGRTFGDRGFRPLAERLAEKLRNLRGETGLSQVQMARRLRISRSTLNRLEAAGQNTTLRTLDHLCRALKCQPGALFKGMRFWLSRRSVTANLIDVRAPDRRRRHYRKLRNPLSRSY